jgi:hypothetical protein
LRRLRRLRDGFRETVADRLFSPSDFNPFEQTLCG